MEFNNSALDVTMVASDRLVSAIRIQTQHFSSVPGGPGIKSVTREQGGVGAVECDAA